MKIVLFVPANKPPTASLLSVLLLLLISCSPKQEPVRVSIAPPSVPKGSDTGEIESQPDSDYVSSYTDQFGAVLQSEVSQSKIARIIFAEKRSRPFDLDLEDIRDFHNYFGYPSKTKLSSSQSGIPLQFVDTYDDAEVYFDGNGKIGALKFWSSRLSLPNKITVGSDLELVRKYYPDGFEYPESSTSLTAKEFHKTTTIF